MILPSPTLLPLLQLLLQAGGSHAEEVPAIERRTPKRPNVVVFLTDDQDAQLGSLQYMPGVQKHLMEQGITYEHHYCTIALCCPSRVNLWTGQAAHNTNVTDLAPPWGGYPKFTDEGLDDQWLPTLLQNAGYNTYYTGKLMNAHTISNYNKPYAKGFTGHDYLLEPGTYQYWNATYQHNTDPPVSYPGLYTVDILQNRSSSWLDEAAQSDKPFFLAIAPVAPHASLLWNQSKGTGPMPNTQYMDLFNDLEVPRTENFNPDTPSGASWLRNLEKLNSSQIAYGDEWYRNRTRTLQSVDELVNATIAKLTSIGVLDNTYIAYSADNGFHISNHRLQPGKRCPYEEDINVPLIIRGPGIPANFTQNTIVTTHTDLTPTILNWTGVAAPVNSSGKSILDGQAIPTTLEVAPANATTGQVWEHVQVEHWGPGLGEGIYKEIYTTTNNTYKAVRVLGSDYNLYYAVWCDGSHELYDMSRDSQQMQDIYATNKTILGRSVDQVALRLDALTLVLKTCVADTCTQPWSALHPNGKVVNLKQALDKKYDAFYKEQNKVAFEECLKGYLIDNEMPIQYYQYGGNLSDGVIGVVRRGNLLEDAMWDEHIKWQF